MSLETLLLLLSTFSLHNGFIVHHYQIDLRARQIADALMPYKVIVGLEQMLANLKNEKCDKGKNRTAFQRQFPTIWDEVRVQVIFGPVLSLKH